MDGNCSSAADLLELLPVPIHGAVPSHPSPETLQDNARQGVRVFGPTIVHPFPVSPGLDESGAFEIREMSRNLRLDYVEGVSQMTDAHLAARKEIQ